MTNSAIPCLLQERLQESRAQRRSRTLCSYTQELFYPPPLPRSARKLDGGRTKRVFPLSFCNWESPSIGFPSIWTCGWFMGSLQRIGNRNSEFSSILPSPPKEVLREVSPKNQVPSSTYEMEMLAARVFARIFCAQKGLPFARQSKQSCNVC